MRSSLSDNDDERANEISELSGDSPVSQIGDVWILNEHRVFCASALERNSYTTLMGKDRAEMVFIDPPYNVAIDGNVSGLGATRHREFAMASGEMSKEEFQQFLTKVFLLLAKHSTPHSLHFVCMDWRHTGEVVAAGEDIYNELINCCVWVKDNAGWGPSIEASMNLCLCSNRKRALIATTFNLVSTAATVLMYGITRAPIRFRVRETKAICWLFIRPSNLRPSWAMPSWTVPSAEQLSWIAS